MTDRTGPVGLDRREAAVVNPLKRALRIVSQSLPAIGDAMLDDSYRAVVDIELAEKSLSDAMHALVEAKRAAGQRPRPHCELQRNE